MTSALATACYHCGEPSRTDIHEVIAGESRHFCCHGCRMAALMVCELGLSSYYAQRDGFSQRPAGKNEFPFDDPAFVAALCQVEGDRHVVELQLHGLHSSACVWLIEATLKQHAAVARAQVYLSSERLALSWEAREAPLAELVARVEALGYTVSPYDASGRDRHARRLQTSLLLRVGTAGLSALATGFMADPLNATTFDPLHMGYRWMFVALSLAIGTPALAYVGWPFFRGAWSSLRARSLTMDVSIAVAALAAWLASVWGMVSGGPLYFDCALSFMFLLLAGRFVEGWAKRRVFRAAEALWRLEAPMATRIEEDGERQVPTSSVRVGDRLRIRPGDRVPVDGQVEAGAGSLDEALLTGEAVPVAKRVDDELSAGTLNLEGSMILRATRVGSETTLAQIVRWVSEADGARSPSETLANRVSTVFLPLLFLVAAGTFALNLGGGLDVALRHTISVLIVTCPCALGLATPAAIAVAMARGARDGVLFKSGTELEGLHLLTHLVLDKTGTLTTGQMQVVDVSGIAGWSPDEVLSLAACVEAASEHPLARAVCERAKRSNLPLGDLQHFHSSPGEGVAGEVDGRAVRVGTLAWLGRDAGSLAAPQRGRTALYVEVAGQIVGGMEACDTLRAEALELVSALRRRGLALEVVSGDRPEAVEPVAHSLGIESFLAGARPRDKRERVERLKGGDRRVGMIGDGINDAPAMAAAHLGIALGRGSALTATAAGVVLLGDRLDQLLGAIGLSERTASTIKQNFALSALYNALVVPAAALGHVAPTWAAVLMPASSLLVLLNALRLAR